MFRGTITKEDIVWNQEAFTIQPGETSTEGFGFVPLFTIDELKQCVQDDTLVITCTMTDE